MVAELAGAHQKTLGAGKNDDEGNGCRTPADRCDTLAWNTSHPGGSANNGRTTRHKGYAKSIDARRGIEKMFGWINQWVCLRQFNVRGTQKVSVVLGLHVIAHYLLTPATAAA